MGVLKPPPYRRPRMASIASSLQRIKDTPLGLLDRRMVEQACHDCHYTWRERELDPATTIALFLQQVVHGNTSCGEVRHLAGRSFTAQAYCDARARLPLSVYQTLLTEAYYQLVPHLCGGEHLWHGHRTFHVDASTFSMPDTPGVAPAIRDPSGPKPRRAFPTPHLPLLFRAATGMLIDTWASPLRTGDVAETPEAHLHLNEGDILIGDDAYSGYPHLAMLQKQGLHGLFPVHHLRIVDFKKGRPHCTEGSPVAGITRSPRIKSRGQKDHLVEDITPKHCPTRRSEEE